MSKPLTQLTFAEHEEACSEFNPEPPNDLPKKISPDQKWIAVSQLQKAIRRGESTIAIDWAHALWEADRSYGLFRLGVIAAEEIAGADPALARAFLQSEIKKTWFDERGGFRSLAYFVDAFCLSPKDRTSCDLASTASLVHLGAAAPARGTLDYSLLRSISQDVAQPIPARISALWLLAGTAKISNSELGADRPGRLIDFLGACDSIYCDADLLFCIDMSLRLNKEPNPIALALCRAAQDAAPSVARSLDIPNRIIGGALTCAIDAHTREGRLAIEALLRQSTQAKMLCSTMNTLQEKSKLLGGIFFRLEGHDVFPKIQYPLALQAHDWHCRKLSKLAGIPKAELFASAQDLLPELDELRLDFAPWAFSIQKKPKPA